MKKIVLAGCNFDVLMKLIEKIAPIKEKYDPSFIGNTRLYTLTELTRIMNALWPKLEGNHQERQVPYGYEVGARYGSDEQKIVDEVDSYMKDVGKL